MEASGEIPNVKGAKNCNYIKPNLHRSFCDQTESRFFFCIADHKGGGWGQ